VLHQQSSSMDWMPISTCCKSLPSTPFQTLALSTARSCWS
jgi:hypothetical protein